MVVGGGDLENAAYNSMSETPAPTPAAASHAAFLAFLAMFSRKAFVHFCI